MIIRTCSKTCRRVCAQNSNQRPVWALQSLPPTPRSLLQAPFPLCSIPGLCSDPSAHIDHGSPTPLGENASSAPADLSPTSSSEAVLCPTGTPSYLELTWPLPTRPPDCRRQRPSPQQDPRVVQKANSRLFPDGGWPTHLGVEGSQTQAASRGEEQRGHRDLDEEGGHHAEPV